MQTQTLAEFVGRFGQEGAAQALGASQAAISKALRSKRLIIVAPAMGGGFEATELKRFPSGGGRPRAVPSVPMATSSADLEPILPSDSHIRQCADTAVQASSMGAEQ
ncbi:Cro/CI family transcriptional regulator [Pseudomonas aeruginosa]|uniref:Cro/CI family transcriptional regulator n=1 Tax=Pseudomonas aeruginosa TaxID=287 RepID=UPI002076149A|nr:Cro/CI family transcriptional regulator [Pseudomonas aeruginosa]HBO5614781.1 hypothetical protein [Pseudomonas aeruginosa]